MSFESLPVELIAEILGELDLESLIKVSYLSRRLYNVAADPSLNPWRRPILRNLGSNSYESCLEHLGVRTIVPRQNWVDILSIASPSFLLFQATLPKLKMIEWEECFARRFLPGWRMWRRDGTWKEVFVKMLHRIWHRTHSTCTADEAWTKYITLNRNGTANQLEASSRSFNPIAIFNVLKLQNNLAHLETRVRVGPAVNVLHLLQLTPYKLVLELIDVRILALGTLCQPRTRNINANAHLFLHPPGIDTGDHSSSINSEQHHTRQVDDHGVYPMKELHSVVLPKYPLLPYKLLTHPSPAPSHANYPYYTPGGGDKRWLGSVQVEEDGLRWVGSFMIVAQLLGPRVHDLAGDRPPLQDLDLVIGPGRQQYSSFTWADLSAITPWMEDAITKKINGPGLGI